MSRAPDLPRVRIARALVFVLCLGTPLGAYAQAGADDAVKAMDPAWVLYDQAFERLAAGDAETARVLLETLRDRFPDHPAAAQAARRLAEGPAAGRVPLPPDAGEPPEQPGTSAGREQPSRFARGELALMMTLHGVLTGQRVCSMLDCTGTRATAASTMLGGGAGLGLSLYFSRRGVTPGQTLLMTSAMTWGAWNGAGFTEFGDSNGDAAAVVLSQAAGVGLGVGMWHAWKPTAGEVSMANTTGFWTAIMTLMFHGLVDKEPELQTVVVASDVGLLVGGYLGSRLEHISRGRALVIDTGGILGFLAGGLIAVIMEPNDDQVVFAPLILGTTAGLGVAAYVTRRWDAPELPNNATVTLAPMGKDGWGAAVFWQWQ